jgi:CheY-like chemotaxis protein
MDRAILVVDDDPFIRKVITELLEADGYRPTAVGDSTKALELFAARSFDLVLTDYNMPVMTGVELARRMKMLRPSIPVCLVTAIAGGAHAEAFEAFDGLLEKPFRKPQLRSLVETALSANERNLREFSRPTRYEVDWRVDYIPLAAPTLTREVLEPHRGALRNLSEHGLAFVAAESLPSDRFCAFLIYPPRSTDPSLMVGEVLWTVDEAGEQVVGTRSVFWGSEREKTSVIEQAM